MKCFVVIASLMVAGTKADPKAKAEPKPEAEHPVPYGYTPAPPPPAPYVHHPEPAYGAPVIAAAPEPLAPVAPEPVAPEPAIPAPVHHRPVPFTVFSPHFHAPAAPVEPVAPAEPAPAPVHPVTPVYPGYGTPAPPVVPVEPVVHPVTPVYPGYGPPAVAPVVPEPAAPVEPVAPVVHPVTPVYPGYGHHAAPIHPIAPAYPPAPAHPVPVTPLLLHHPTPSALPHLPPHHQYNVPKCSKDNPKTWCLTDDEYPTYEIQKAAEYHYDKVQQLYKDIDANTKNSVDRLKELVQETYLCPSETQYIKPKRAVNVDWKWRIIVNDVKAHYDTLTQTARIEECTTAGSACPLVPACYETKCLQKSTYHRFLVFDPYDEYLPFKIESFKLPSACACYNGAFAEPPHKK